MTMVSETNIKNSGSELITLAAGNFESSPGGTVSSVVTGTLLFDQADTRRINLRFVGPYPYPSDITVNLRVNNGEWHGARLSCQ